MNGQLGFVDLLIMAVYLVGTIALGLHLGRGMKSGRDYFLAGRSLPWWTIGLSLVATDIGGTDIIGVGGAAYTHGLAVANFEWIGCVPAMIVAAFVFIPFFWRLGIYTIPEYMERRYHVSVRVALAACWLVFMACNLGVMLYASAKMMTVSMGVDLTGYSLGGWSLAGWEITACVVAIALLAGLYTFAGGLAAVVYTDSIQCTVMIGGCLLVLVMGLMELGGIQPLIERLEQQERQAAEAGAPQDHVALIQPVDTPGPFPWTGILFGLALILSPAYWIGNQAIVQRSLGARSAFEAKAAYIWGSLLKNLIPVIIVLPGLVAVAVLPDLDDGDTALPLLATGLLPLGLRGVFVAAFLAALMSSVDSYLNAAATIFTNDFYERFRASDSSSSGALTVGRYTTLVLVLWAIGFALWISTVEGSGIYVIFQTLMSFFQGPALAILLMGVLWRRANAAGALVGFVGGVSCAVGLFVLNQPTVLAWLGWQPLFRIEEPFLYFSVWAFLTAAALHAAVSLLTPAQPFEQIASLLYRTRHAIPEASSQESTP
jgi:solute:Na+ symporter, SSS family